MNKPDPASALGPSHIGSVLGPTPAGQVYTVILTVSKLSTTGRSQFQNALPSDGLLRVTSSSIQTLPDGVATCTLSFASANGDVALIASTCNDDAVLAPGQSCTLTFVVTPTVSTAKTIPASRVPKFRGQLKAALKG